MGEGEKEITKCYATYQSTFNRIFLLNYSTSHEYLSMTPSVLSNNSGWCINKDVLSYVKTKLSCETEGHMPTAVSCVLRI